MIWRLPLTVVLAAVLLVTPTGLKSRAATSVNTPLQPQALARLAVRSIPQRDLYALTTELVPHAPRSIPHVVRRTSPNYPVGHQDNFYVLSEDSNRYFVMHATIRAESPHLYIYVQNGLRATDATLQRAADQFERSIYPTDRAAFGTEWRPGVDGDPHITCLVGNLRSAGVGGYFSADDEYPRSVNRYSNEREMIYLDADQELPGDPYFDSTMAHEFQHMIHWNMHPHDNIWLNEGMSMLAEKLNGFSPQGEAEAFLSRPATQIDAWKESASESIPHYGASYLFLAYLYDHYGRGIISDLLSDKRHTDFQLIDDVLKKRHIHETAESLFRKWVVANVVADRSLGNGMYGYRELPHLADRVKVSVGVNRQSSLPPYAAQYLDFESLQGQKPFRLRFSAPSTVPVVKASSTTPFWWANRGDMSDTSLQRSVDLTHVSHATLHFKTWYDIEKDYDYAYVEASRDGGKTWSTLRGTHTTRSNPNGASYGNAYTGASKGWRTETVDLSPYAGHRIELRFEYVTDEGYTGQGFVVRGITIPEIGFRDNFTGWQPRGFLPVAANALPSRWTVQLISYTSQGTVRVTRLPLSGGKGSVLIDPAGQGLKRMIVAIYLSAPKTTVESKYQLSAQPS